MIIRNIADPCAGHVLRDRVTHGTMLAGFAKE